MQPESIKYDEENQVLKQTNKNEQSKSRLRRSIDLAPNVSENETTGEIWIWMQTRN